MLGAIIGDIIGSRFEWDNHRSKDFELFTKECFFTDDSVLTCATANTLLKENNYQINYQQFAIDYPGRGYGGMFRQWVNSKSLLPYGSYGNGSAMRVSPIGWFFKSLDEVREEAKKSASATHNHPEGIEGAQATAAAIFLAREGMSLGEIRKYLEATTQYRFKHNVQYYQENNRFDESCKGTVPVAVTCVLESVSFEDCIRNAVSVGGDTDTICAIAGSIAEAAFGIPTEIKDQTLPYLDSKLVSIIKDFYAHVEIKY